MTRKIIIPLIPILWISFNTQMIAQLSYRIIADTSEGIQRQVNSVITGSGVTGINGEADIIVNTLHPKLNYQFIEIIRMNSREQLLTSFKLSAKDYLLTSMSSSEEEGNLYILFSAQKVGIPDSNYLLLCCLDLRSKRMNWLKPIESGDFYSDGQLLYVDSTLILAYHQYDSKGVQENRIGKYTSTGDLILKKRIGNADDGIILANLTINSNGAYFLSLLGMDSPFIKGTYLIRLDHDLNIEKSVNVKFYSTGTGILLNRGYWHLGLESLGANVHLVAQPIIGRDGLGFVSITLFDEDLVLKTWRNYAPQFRLEDFKIGPGRFLICGHRDILSGQDGLGFSAINNLNAIPEINSIYKKGFEAFSVGTSSGIAALGSRGIIAVTSNFYDNKSDVLAVASQSDNVINSCNESFVFNVTKDRIDVSDYDSIHLYQINDSGSSIDITFRLDTIPAFKQLICTPVGVIDIHPEKKCFIQTQDENFLTIGLNGDYKEIESGYLVSSDGRMNKVPLFKSDSNSRRIPISQLVPGIYFLRIDEYSNLKFLKP